MPSKTYYKATRPDGTDFYSGTIKYEVGKIVRPHPVPNGPGEYSQRTLCGPGVLHASTELGETLLGGRWPCRLFEVSGVSKLQQGPKHGFYQLKVARELQAWKALGPNGKEVVALIERCRTLTRDEILGLGAARGAAWGAAWDAAWDAAWGAARGAAWGAAWGAARDAARGAAWDAAWGAARGAAWGAASALLVKDLISQERFDRLCGPWKTAIEG